MRFSAVLTPEKPLHFEGLDDQDELELDVADVEQTTGDLVDDAPSREPQPDPQGQGRKPPDPDDIVDFDEEQEEEECGCSSDDDLVPYDVDDDYSDLDDEQTPGFIRECLSKLGSNPEDKAFVSLAELSGRPAEETGLDREAVNVLDCVMFLHDVPGVDNYSELKRRVLVNALLSSPSACARRLCDAFHEPSHALCDRIDILYTLSEGATRLYNNDVPGTTPLGGGGGRRALIEERAPGSDLVPVRPYTKPHRDVALDLVEKKSRSWHTQRDSQNGRAAPNMFYPVADTFFYPLISRFDVPVFATNSAFFFLPSYFLCSHNTLETDRR